MDWGHFMFDPIRSAILRAHHLAGERLQGMEMARIPEDKEHYVKDRQVKVKIGESV